MDLSFKDIKCPYCNTVMNDGSVQVGPNMIIIGKFCPNCKQSIIIVPTKNDAEYKITKITEERRLERDKIIKEFKAIFDVTQIPVLNSWILENEYNGDFYSPWLLIETQYGMIEIGWRKRVIQIDWSHTNVRKIISNDDVTKNETFIHAHSNAKAVEYLSHWIKIAVKCG